ncbi:hypothetical protein HGM15179_002168 [Zosterops borbonicus]|uniref:LIM zinc-binding domain-containing protein n=1 Tax=Zosterops borbonicus TaxID=364589 RepID=A0A8K1LSY9_9PASS|nr:hypothetical protein HGM15179_002168 [Zosterops borbonicus]
MNPQCARCGKVVYPTEKVNCLDKYWHKGCFHCEVCKMALNMNNYKGYEKKPYCNALLPEGLEGYWEQYVPSGLMAAFLSVVRSEAKESYFVLSAYSWSARSSIEFCEKK